MTGPILSLSCPAQHGNCANINSADFILVAEDCVKGPDGWPTVTDMWGYFRLPGPEHDDDALLTGGLEVPIGSPIARIAHRVAANPRRTRRMAMLLRGDVARCPCTAKDECPALSEVRLLEAMERVTG